MMKALAAAAILVATSAAAQESADARVYPAGIYYCKDPIAQGDYLIEIGQNANMVMTDGEEFGEISLAYTKKVNPLNDFSARMAQGTKDFGTLKATPTSATLRFTDGSVIKCTNKRPQPQAPELEG